MTCGFATGRRCCADTVFCKSLPSRASCKCAAPQITAEVQHLIEETAAAFQEYQATRAEVGRHLAAAQASTDALARPLSPLPALRDGLDEVTVLLMLAFCWRSVGGAP